MVNIKKYGKEGRVVARISLIFLFLATLLTGPSFAFNLSLTNKSSEKNNKKIITFKPDEEMTKGLSLFYNGKSDLSYKLLDKVDRKFNWGKEKENAFSKFFKSVVTTVANEKVLPYQPWMFEMINVNTFKAIDCLVKQDFKKSRVEFNRALVRELEAENEFKKEIEKKQKELEKEKEKAKKNKDQIDQNLKRSYSYLIKKYYSNIDKFQAYSGFLNPFTEYISAIFFYSSGDYQKATDLFKKCFGIIKGKEPAASIVARDFKDSFQRMSSTSSSPTKKVWIIFLNGQIAQKKELRVDLPLFILTKKVVYTGLAIPQIGNGKITYPYVTYTFGKKHGKTKRIVDMDILEKAEFKKRLPSILMKAITRAVVLTLAQSKTGKGGKLLIGGYQFLMNRADTRQWKNLPKEVQVASLKVTSKSKLIISIPGGEKKEFEVSSDKNTIIFVSAPTKGKVSFYKVEI